MNQILLLLGLLTGPLLLQFAGVSLTICARIGLTLVLGFAGLGHFVKHREMVEMLPASLPARQTIVYATGMAEWAFTPALWSQRWSHPAGIALCLFFAAVFPANIHAARARIAFGGHASGPRYLWVRAPLQILLIAWTFCFVVRP